MKKLIALLLATFMSMSVLAACSNEETPEEPTDTPAETPAEEEPAEEEPGEVSPLPEWEAYDALIKEIKTRPVTATSLGTCAVKERGME